MENITEEKKDDKDEKKQKKTAQLQAARQNALEKRKADKLELESLRAEKPKEENQTKPEKQEEPPKKKQRITKDSEDDNESWTTAGIRTFGVLVLGAGTWYLNNIYGKKPIQKSIPVQTIEKNSFNQPIQSKVNQHGFAS